MIEKIIGATLVPDMQGLAWAHQIGWFAEGWNKASEVGEGEFKSITYPVAQNVAINDCESTALGLKVLTTDKGWKSLILIEEESDLASIVAANIPQRRAISLEQEISIKVWMNDHQGSVHLAKADLISLFFKKTYKQFPVAWYAESDTDYDFYVNKLKVNFVREIQGNPFSEYSFASDQAQFHNTYAAFGFILKLSALVFPACFPAYPELVHSDCDVVPYGGTINTPSVLTTNYSLVEQVWRYAKYIGGHTIYWQTWFFAAGTDAYDQLTGLTVTNHTIIKAEIRSDNTAAESVEININGLRKNTVDNVYEVQNFTENQNIYLTVWFLKVVL